MKKRSSNTRRQGQNSEADSQSRHTQQHQNEGAHCSSKALGKCDSTSNLEPLCCTVPQTQADGKDWTHCTTWVRCPRHQAIKANVETVARKMATHDHCLLFDKYRSTVLAAMRRNWHCPRQQKNWRRLQGKQHDKSIVFSSTRPRNKTLRLQVVSSDLKITTHLLQELSDGTSPSLLHCISVHGDPARKLSNLF